MPFMDMETNMTKKPNTLVIDAISGEQTVREMTDSEFKQYKLDKEASELKHAEIQAKAQAKLVAQAKLAALGLTVEDLQALGL